MGGAAVAANGDENTIFRNVCLAGATLLIIMLLSTVRSAVVSRLSILLGIVLSTLLALGVANFSMVGDGAFFAFPEPLAFGPPTFQPAAIISVTIVVLVILTETTVDIIAGGEIVDTQVDRRRIADGLRADMGASFLPPIFNGFTQFAFAQNAGLVAITGVKSRFVVTAGDVVMLVVDLLPVLGRVVAAVPMPVLGGASLVLFGTVPASGIRTLGKVKYAGTPNLIIVATSLDIGMRPITVPAIYHGFPTWSETVFDSGINSATVAAMALSLLFNEIKVGNPPAGQGSVFREALPPVAPLEHFQNHLREGGSVKDGKLVDSEGKEIPCITASGEVVPAPLDSKKSGTAGDH